MKKNHKVRFTRNRSRFFVDSTVLSSFVQDFWLQDLWFYNFYLWIRDKSSLELLKVKRYALEFRQVFQEITKLLHSGISNFIVSIEVVKQRRSWNLINEKFKLMFCKEMRGFNPFARPSIALSEILQLLWKN